MTSYDGPHLQRGSFERPLATHAGQQSFPNPPNIIPLLNALDPKISTSSPPSTASQVLSTMDDGFRQPAKLQKRKSRERQELAMSGGLSGQTANSSAPLAPSDNMSPSEKEKRSKWRMSNPFHSKDKKDKDKLVTNDTDAERKETTDFRDSAYASSEPNTSANPSLTTTNTRPVSGEQIRPHSLTPQPPTTYNNLPPNAPTHVPTHAPTHDTLAPPQPTLHNRASQESVGKETYRDAGTGNIVTITTTTTTTTVTTTGPGGSTTVEQPNGSNSTGNITDTSGPSPPDPVSPLPGPLHQAPSIPAQSSIPDRVSPSMPTYPQNTYPQGPGLHHQVSKLEASPPLPAKSNIRNRLELDSVSPAIQRPNPMEDTVSPITPASPSRANFSYPARQPPQGVPRQIPSQYGPPHDYPEVPPLPASLQAGNGYNEPGHPVPFRAGHEIQKQSTMANLKAAAAGIHGAGETLRGTFNDTFDRRNPAAHAKNQAIINAGRSEIEAARAAQHQRQLNSDNGPPVPPKGPYAGPPVEGSMVEGYGPGHGTGGTGGGMGGGPGGGLGRGKLGNIMKKMKEGPMASNRDGPVGH